MHLRHPRGPGLLVRDIIYRQVVCWCSSLSGDLFEKFHMPYILVVWYIRLVLIILRVNVIYLC